MYGNLCMYTRKSCPLHDKPQHIMYGNTLETVRPFNPACDKPQHIMYGNFISILFLKIE